MGFCYNFNDRLLMHCWLQRHPPSMPTYRRRHITRPWWRCSRRRALHHHLDTAVAVWPADDVQAGRRPCHFWMFRWNCHHGSAAVLQSFFDELAVVLDRVATYQEPVYVIGDCNVRLDCPDDPHTIQLRRLVESYGLLLHDTRSTHQLGGTLDAVVTRADWLSRALLVTALPAERLARRRRRDVCGLRRRADPSAQTADTSLPSPMSTTPLWPRGLDGILSNRLHPGGLDRSRCAYRGVGVNSLHTSPSHGVDSPLSNVIKHLRFESRV